MLEQRLEARALGSQRHEESAVPLEVARDDVQLTLGEVAFRTGDDQELAVLGYVLNLRDGELLDELLRKGDR